MGSLKPMVFAAALSTAAVVLTAPCAWPNTAGLAATPPERPHHVYLVGSLRVTTPWIDPGGATPGQASGYLVVENRSRTPERLVGVSLPNAADVTLARSGDDQAGTAPSLVVPANGELTLKPGAAHLVLHGLREVIAKGPPVAGTLHFERAGPLPVSFLTDGGEAAADDDSRPSTSRKPTVSLGQ